MDFLSQKLCCSLVATTELTLIRLFRPKNALARQRILNGMIYVDWVDLFLVDRFFLCSSDYGYKWEDQSFTTCIEDGDFKVAARMYCKPNQLVYNKTRG